MTGDSETTMQAATATTEFWHRAYREHGSAVLAFLRSRVGSREDAEELLQETFVRVLRRSCAFDDQRSARAYLFTTAHNLARNHARRRRVSPFVEGPAGEPEAAGSADVRARLRSLLETVERELGGMPEAHRTAFRLGVLDKLPYREIAARTGWSAAQVKINVYRARKRVVEALGSGPGGEVRS